MPLMKWTETYSVGFGKMDDQHKVIFDIINELFDAIRVGESADALDIVNRLIAFTEEHFAEEEAMLKAENNPDLEWQHSEHQKFLNGVADYQKQVVDGKIMEIEKNLSRFLMNWWNTHILDIDMKYAKK